MSQASLTSTNTQSKSDHIVTASPSNKGTNQHVPPPQQPLEPTPEEGEGKLNKEEGEVTEQLRRTGRRREGTMNKSFKFPPDPAAAVPLPPVPDVPKNLPEASEESKPGDGEQQLRKSQGSDEMVPPPNIEVLPPPPIEKEGMVSSVSDLDDVGETEEICLN